MTITAKVGTSNRMKNSMPIVKRCAFACCPIKVTDDKYCISHKPKPRPLKQRGTAAQRGYDYSWQKYRERYLWHNPLCVRCETELNKANLATVVDHIAPVINGQSDPLFWEESNHQALCRGCHSWKTRVIDKRGYGVS